MLVRKKKNNSILVCILTLILVGVFFFALFYVTEQMNHTCCGEECPICSQIHTFEIVIQQMTDGMLLFAFLFVGFQFENNLKKREETTSCFRHTLVSQKVRLNDGEKIATPLSLSETDDKYLKEKGISFDGVLVRKDIAFEYLLEKTNKFNFDTSYEDIQITEEKFVYEDEKITETENMADDNE